MLADISSSSISFVFTKKDHVCEEIYGNHPDYKFNCLANKLITLVFKSTLLCKDEHYFENYELARRNIIDMYKNIADDPILMYFLYAKVIQSGFLFWKNIEFYEFKSSCHMHLVDEKKILPENTNAALLSSYFTSLDSIVVISKSLYDPNKISATDLGNFSHELVHSVYKIVYNNNFEPYANKDLTGKAHYDYVVNKVITKISNTVKSDYDFDHLKYRFGLVEQDGKISYPKNQISFEIVAHYLGYYMELKNNPYALKELDSIFIGIKEFVLEHSIPNLVNYIESSYYCQVIQKFNDEIACKINNDFINYFID